MAIEAVVDVPTMDTGESTSGWKTIVRTGERFLRVDLSMPTTEAERKAFDEIVIAIHEALKRVSRGE